MNATALHQTMKYDLGRASNLARERPTLSDLRRAQIAALRRGDRRRVAAYQAVIFHRLEAVQAEARREAA
jgi:hypothetical protein